MADYISRKAAICEFLSEPTDAHYPSWYAEKLKQIPAADVRPVAHGTWTRVNYEPCGHDYICSECGCKSDGPWNFCHDCGADMRKVVEIEQVKEGAE